MPRRTPRDERRRALGQNFLRDPRVVADVIASSPDAVDQIRKGRNNAFGFLVGQVMKASKGKADPKVATELLKNAIG